MMMPKYALETLGSKELVTFRGRIIFHDNPRELEWLLKGPFRIIELPRHDLGRPLLRLRDHPDLAAVSFPLRKSDFMDER